MLAQESNIASPANVEESKAFYLSKLFSMAVWVFSAIMYAIRLMTHAPFNIDRQKEFAVVMLRYHRVRTL